MLSRRAAALSACPESRSALALSRNGGLAGQPGASASSASPWKRVEAAVPVQRGAGAAAGLHAAWSPAGSLFAVGRVLMTKSRPRSARLLRDARRRCCSRPPSGEQRDGPGGAESWSTTSVRVLGDSDEVLERPDDVSSSPCYWSCGAARRTGRAPRLRCRCRRTASRM
jgi:hypothetical protein